MLQIFIAELSLQNPAITEFGVGDPRSSTQSDKPNMEIIKSSHDVKSTVVPAKTTGLMYNSNWCPLLLPYIYGLAKLHG